MCQWQWILLNTIPYLLFLQIPSFSGSTPLQIATWLTVAITSWRLILILTLVGIDGQYCYTCFDGACVRARRSSELFPFLFSLFFFFCCSSGERGVGDGMAWHGMAWRDAPVRRRSCVVYFGNAVLMNCGGIPVGGWCTLTAFRVVVCCRFWPARPNDDEHSLVSCEPRFHIRQPRVYAGGDP